MKKQNKGYRWQRLERASVLPPSRELIDEAMRFYNVDEAKARALLADYQAQCEMWKNDLYQVQVRRRPEDGLVHINIRRLDGAAVIRDWRHFQQIKNELLGPECEAVEIYPAESRKMDTSNKYHLWGYSDPAFRFPIGFDGRAVTYDQYDSPGMRQRPESFDVREPLP